MFESLKRLGSKKGDTPPSRKSLKKGKITKDMIDGPYSSQATPSPTSVLGLPSRAAGRASTPGSPIAPSVGAPAFPGVPLYHSPTNQLMGKSPPTYRTLSPLMSGQVDGSDSPRQNSLWPKPEPLPPQTKNLFYQLLLHQLRFLKEEWTRTFQHFVVQEYWGVTRVYMNMCSCLDYAGIIAHEMDARVSQFRDSPYSTAFAPPADPADVEDRNAILYSFGNIRDGGLEECCDAWNDIKEAFITLFDEWLEHGVNKAAEGTKACIRKLISIQVAVEKMLHIEIQRANKDTAKMLSDSSLKFGTLEQLRANVDRVSLRLMVIIKPGMLSDLCEAKDFIF
ncbi:hypothetical protein FN846DRAFT_933783 [Sphaerosporella brunnea]|uniref:Uncharacterized protein n=1 Tax=Sphaerosporella brunnea TaxID=1250544 RepID=A0A5J5F5X3_9PEZI|nr:hypothetical protein FN846DRAFT_933783 [Sphaerosporella brunnea]